MAAALELDDDGYFYVRVNTVDAGGRPQEAKQTVRLDGFLLHNKLLDLHKRHPKKLGEQLGKLVEFQQELVALLKADFGLDVSVKAALRLTEAVFAWVREKKSADGDSPRPDSHEPTGPESSDPTPDPSDG